MVKNTAAPSDPALLSVSKQVQLSFTDFLRFSDPQPFGTSALLSANEARLPSTTRDTVWQLAMRNDQQTIERPARQYLWIRRPVHRAGRRRHKAVQTALNDIKALHTLALFTAFVGIAFVISIFVR